MTREEALALGIPREVHDRAMIELLATRGDDGEQMEPSHLHRWRSINSHLTRCETCGRERRPRRS